MPLTRFKLTAIQDGGISTQKLADGAISTAKLADSAVNSAKIGTDVIVAEDLAANSITVSELTDGAVSTAKIADDAITTAKIASTAVGTTELANSSVNASKISWRQYFRTRLNSDITYNDVQEVVVPFGTSGVVDFDSESGFGADYTNSYTFPVDNDYAQFWILGYQAIGTTLGTTQGELRDFAAGLRTSTDGTTWNDLTSSHHRAYDNASTAASDATSATLSSTYILSIPAGSQYYLRMEAYANTDAGVDWELVYRGGSASGGTVTFDDVAGTFLWGARIY